MLKRNNAYVLEQQLASYFADFKSQALSAGNDSFRFIEGGQSMGASVACRFSALYPEK
jgi:hypothetical protein